MKGVSAHATSVKNQKTSASVAITVEDIHVSAVNLEDVSITQSPVLNVEHATITALAVFMRMLTFVVLRKLNVTFVINAVTIVSTVEKADVPIIISVVFVKNVIRTVYTADTPPVVQTTRVIYVKDAKQVIITVYAV